jgi:CRP/FNR family transcriptional regulator, cyclic AMP receptor protein
MIDIGAEPPDEVQQKLLARFGRRFSAGSVVFSDGDIGTEAFLLQEGRIRLIKRVGAVERSLRLLRSGDLFGESALIPGAPRNSTAVAVTDGVMMALDHSTLEQVMASNPTVGMRVLQQLIRRLRDAEDQIEILMLHDSRSKVVVALLKLSQQAATNSTSIELAISPLELASRVGLDVDMVKRAVQDLREAGHLQIVGEKVQIPDIQTLKELLGLLAVRDQIAGPRRADEVVTLGSR